MQKIENPASTTIHDLRRGDIFVFDFYGVPHAGIYAPTPGGQGDIIHMYFDNDRTGSIKSTLSKLLLSGSEVYIFRNKKLDGESIAAQAEFWLNQGIEYEKPRLAKSLYPYADTVYSEDYNILKYLLIAARRETMPIKTHQFPCPPSSKIADAGLTMLLPAFNYCWPIPYVGSKLAMYDSKNPDRPRGMTCITFVLACIAAVALKDEIQPVNAKTGWVSLKHGDKHPGLQDLFTDESLKNLDVDRIKKKLTPLIFTLDPHNPSPHEFYDGLRNDADNWEFVGAVDKTIVKEFDKQAYRQEQQSLVANIKANRQKFIETFGEEIFNRHADRPARRFTIFNEPARANQPAQQESQTLRINNNR